MHHRDKAQPPAEYPRRLIRIAVYVMLALSAACTFLFGSRLWQAAHSGQISVWTALAAPLAFTAFVFVYAIDRWLLVRRSNYPPSRAFIQIALAVSFFVLLWPPNAAEYRQLTRGGGPNHAAQLLKHRRADVRALACEVLGYRREVAALDTIRTMAERDKAANVRRACHEAALKLDAATTALP